METVIGISGQRTLDERITNDGAVTAYVAEVPNARPYGIGIAGFLDLRSVEVVKGPVGTLFGRNATGGVIDIKTKDPVQTFSGVSNLSYGNYNTISTQDYVTGRFG